MRKALLLMTVCLFLISCLAVTALAARAVSAERPMVKPTAAPLVYDRAKDRPPDEALGGKFGFNDTQLGYRADPDMFVGWTVGLAYRYEHQHNESMGRNIVRGRDGRFHFVWMSAPAELGDRSVYYRSALRNMIGWTFSPASAPVTILGNNSGYINVAAFKNVAVPVHHSRDTADVTLYHSLSWKDLSPGTGDFLGPYWVPDSVCGGLSTYSGPDSPEGQWIWPTVDVETSADGNSFVMHMVATESADTLYASLLYWRATSFDDNMYGPCGHFVDSVISSGAVVTADRGTDKVAIVYPQCKYNGTYMPYPSRIHSDVVYMESTNDGVTWPTSPTKITNYVNEDSVFNLGNLTALYTADHNLHVVWDDGYAWPDEAGADVIWVYTTPGRLHHWDRDNGVITVVADPEYIPGCTQGWDCGAFNRTVAKPNLTECAGNIYVTYTWFSSYEDSLDCSEAGFANGEIYARTSSTDGLTWGPPVNLTNTRTNGCAAGACQSEHWASTPRYNTDDTLTVFYTGDTDPGASTYDEATASESQMKFLRHPCFVMETFVELSLSPDALLDPFHAKPSETVDTTIVMTNKGNTDADYTVSITPGASWLTVDEAGGSIPPAINNYDTLHVHATGPATEGLYQAEIEIDHNDTKTVLTIPVHLYCFENFFVPENATIRTAANRLNVQQVSRVGDQESGAQMTWFSDNKNYLYDGSLFLSWDRDHTFMQIFHNVGDTVVDYNPRKEIRALGVTEYDSTSYPYRYATGKGCTADSTIGITSKFYASKHPDSAGFYVGHFYIYAGPQFGDLGGPVTGMTIGYATDWDIPSDSGSDNKGYVDSTLQLVYQQGQYAGSGNEYRYGGIAYRGDYDENKRADGGFYWMNFYYVYPDDETNPLGGYHLDSLLKYTAIASTWGPVPAPSVADTIDDLNSVIVIDRDAVLGADDTISFCIIFAATNDGTGPKSVADLKTSIKKGGWFVCDEIKSDAPHCMCGDADGNGIFNIADAVYLIGYIFGGGNAPMPKFLGDADGNCIINIADAVYLIGYIFGGGSAPHCSGTLCNW